MNKKWILYVGGFEMPDGNAAAQRVIGNAKAFRNLGYETFFIGLSRDKDSCNKITSYENFKYINFQYPESLKDWLSYLTSIEIYRPYLGQKPDFIIAYNFPSIALSKLQKWCKKNSISIYADCTEWYEPKGNILFRLIKGFDTWYRMEKVHLKMDGLIAISDYLYNYYSPMKENVVNIPPLVDLSMCKWELDDKQDLVEDNIVNIIYAGSPGGGNKDRLDLILEALSMVIDEKVFNFRFNVIGITREQYLNIFENPIPENLKNNIIFKGRLSHLNTLKEIKNSHFYLFIRENNLTNRAGFPTKFSESISCGTPVITNSTSNINEYIINGANGFIIENLVLNQLKEVLKNAILLPKTQIKQMKNYCYQSHQFDYRKFLLKFKDLIFKAEKI